MISERIPLFPLNTVLFPGMALPLQVFEPRYLEMVDRCLDTHGCFGVCLIRSGQEVGGPAEPHLVGTTAEILSARQAGERRLVLVTVGRTRFRILRLFHERPYAEAEVEYLPEGENYPAPEILSGAREAALLYFETLGALPENDRDRLTLPADAASLANLLGAVLQVPPSVRQALLEVPDAARRLARAVELVHLELGRLADEAQRSAGPYQVDRQRLSLN